LKVDDLCEGTIVVLGVCSQETRRQKGEDHMNQTLSNYILNKNQEIWIQLSEVDEGDKFVKHHDKIQMSYLFNKKDIVKIIMDVLENKVEEDYIRVHIESKYGSNSQLGFMQQNAEGKNLKDFIIDSNSIHFEVLPFPQKQLETNFIVKIKHYTQDNQEGEVFTVLVDKDFSCWDMMKQMVTEHFSERDKAGAARNYHTFLINKSNDIIQRLVNPAEKVHKLMDEMSSKGCILRMNPMTEDLRKYMEEKNPHTHIAICFSVDQYDRAIGCPFIVPFQKNFKVSTIRNRILESLLQQTVIYNASRRIW